MDGWSGEELVAGVERWGGTFTDPVRSGKPLIVERSDAYHVVQVWQQTFEEHKQHVDLFNIVNADGALKIRYTEGWQPMGWSQAAEVFPIGQSPKTLINAQPRTDRTSDHNPTRSDSHMALASDQLHHLLPPDGLAELRELRWVMSDEVVELAGIGHYHSGSKKRGLLPRPLRSSLKP